MGFSGTEGAYAFDLQPGRYRISFGSDSHEVQLAAGEDRVLDHEVSGACEVRVLVRGQGVRPENALVVLEQVVGDARHAQQGRSGLNGVATFANVPPGTVMVSAGLQRERGGMPIQASRTVDVPEKGYLEVVLEPPQGKLGLHVVQGPKQLPVPQADINVFDASGEQRLSWAIANRDGVAEISGLEDETVILTIHHPTCAPGVFTLKPDRGGLLQTLALDPGREIQVTAKTRAEEVLGVIIHARTVDGPPELTWPIRLSKEGTGTLGRIPTGPVKLEIIAAGMERFYVTVGAKQERLDLVLDPVPGAPGR